ncbi:type VI secretion system secreted protein VgrG [Cribrihabitans marinus]|uniref:Type VI secretion system secreted protein VgrG n=1 Tax=Cribrihabitans marinus TaxID=1227549 RepID=A0A1H7DYA5_9RHOB|nr:type VI secretion system tip protein TssI/VgrG [Cribrihabitans marinus]SEK03285.1 type VI secretion system secreted protein VgrG [Cribrihabitans marinus]
MAEAQQTEWPLRITGTYSYDDDKVLIRRAIVRERLGKLASIQVEFLAELTSVELKEFLGKIMTIHLTTADGSDRKFTGTIVEVERLALRDAHIQLLAELRPWFWMLDQTSDSRIFQEKSTVQIVEQIFSEHGFSDYTLRLSGSYDPRPYCVQYRETDFAFISRLLEEEGIYYYFDYRDAVDKYEKLVLADDASGHDPIEGESTIEYRPGDDTRQRLDDAVTEWGSSESVITGMMSLRDFDFLTPSADLEVRARTKTTAQHSHKDYERYDYPGHYRQDTGLGTKRAEVRQEARDVMFDRRRGRVTVRSMATGSTFTLKEHPEAEQNKEYLVLAGTYYLQTTEGYGFEKKGKDLDTGALEFPEDITEGDMFTGEIQVQLKTTAFRSPPDTPWPRIPGLHTALVTGPPNGDEEIYTDEHGRIRVQFHWDRECDGLNRTDNDSGQHTSCWVRVATPWSGKNWGMIHIPRVGQEVVVQFEEGKPDRPICTGMLYNAETMPPYPLPDNKTQSGIMTRSSEGGTADTYNELMFEDLTGEELVRFQAQKDYLGLIKDRSAVTVGLDEHEPTVESTDEFSYALTVKNHMTEIVKEGDHTFTVETGSQIVTIETDQTETISGESTRTVTGNHSETIEQGDKSTLVSLGNISVDASAGSIAIEAAMEIKLTVGGSSITIDQMGVTIQAPTVAINGDMSAELTSGMSATVDGGLSLTLNAAATTIN